MKINKMMVFSILVGFFFVGYASAKKNTVTIRNRTGCDRYFAISSAALSWSNGSIRGRVSEDDPRTVNKPHLIRNKYQHSMEIPQKKVLYLLVSRDCPDQLEHGKFAWSQFKIQTDRIPSMEKRWLRGTTKKNYTRLDIRGKTIDVEMSSVGAPTMRPAIKFLEK